MSRHMLLTIISLVAVLAISCSESSPVAGGAGGETTNGITAAIVRTDGSPAASASVRLRRDDWVAQSPELARKTIFGADALTDANGWFEINGIDAGSYCVEVSDTLLRQSLLLKCSIDNSALIDLGTDTLRAFATVRGSVDPSRTPGVSRFVQVYGLDRLVLVDPTGAYTISDLPTGNLRLRIVSADTTIEPVIIDSVQTSAGSVTDLPMAGWTFSRQLFLNTTVTGANIPEDVISFSLLVRIDAASLDFTQARDSGQDLRFTKSDGSALPCEIEEWDRANRQAVAWVRIDTVRGNDSSQYILMHWGNPTAISASNSAAVFDTADGNAGVWHLGGSTRDATAFGNDPAPSSIPSSAGTISGSQGFDGTDVLRVPDSVSMGTLDPAGRSFSLSAWFRSTDTSDTRLISKDHYNFSNGYYLGYGGGMICASIGSGGDTAQTIFYNTTDLFNDGLWHQAVAVFDRTAGRGYIYVDGIRQSVSSAAGLCGTSLGSEHDLSACTSLSTQTSEDLAIGGCLGDGRFITGDVDEARVTMEALPQAWVELSYANQRPDQRLVEFGQ